MFEAYVNGKNIRPDDYNAESHEGKTQCPCDFCRDDENYNPEMPFRKGAKTVDAGSKPPRRDHFFTKGNHHPDCEAYEHEYTYRESFKKLKDGGHVLFNLALIPQNITKMFNVRAADAQVTDLIHEQKWKSSHKGYRPICIHETEKLIKIIDRFKEDIENPDCDLDENALDRCFFHSGAFVVSYKDFDLRDNTAKLNHIFGSMASERPGSIVSSKSNNGTRTKYVFGFPRLIEVQHTRPCNRRIQGDSSLLETEKHGQQKLTNVIKLKIDKEREATRKDILEHQNVYIISTASHHF